MRQFTVTGMSCAACAARVEKSVSALPGVITCSVSLLTNSMGVEGDTETDTIIKAVENAGYGAAIKGATNKKAENNDDLEDRITPKLKRRLFLSLGFLVALMYISMGHSMLSLPVPVFLENPVFSGLMQLILAEICMLINYSFFVNGFKGAAHLAPNMDTLVALGSASAFVYSTVELFIASAGQMLETPDYYFESSAMILTLITVGKILEARSKGKTTDALKSLMKLLPKTATIEREGREISITIDDLGVGDIFIVRPGDIIPVDGIITEGQASIDESTLTGESIPADKITGDKVFAATTNRDGYFKAKAVKVGEDTSLAQIIQMVSDAAATKAPIAKIADRVSGVFVPAVILIAIITLCVWLIAGKKFGFSLARAISVLVISCPCALGLATPVAIMVGNGLGAKHGILFKTAKALEETGKTQIVALDKTGTITQGNPAVTDVITALGESESELLQTAVSLESLSEHPLAHAITAYGESLKIKPAELRAFKAKPGNGLSAIDNESLVIGGSFKYIGSMIQIPEELDQIAHKLADEGKTPLLFVKADKILGIIAVADTVKSDSAEAIRELKKMGIKVVMLTGDNSRTAHAIAKQVDADVIISDVLPEGKEKAIRALASQGNVVMVGDGINDAPALTSANIGIAIGTGADVAVDAADIVLINSSLSDVSAAIRLSRKTLLNIKENLFWAFFYNAICIPLAAGVFIVPFGLELNPMIGAAAMSLSSFCVVSNALRLNLFNIYDSSRDRKPKIKKHNKKKENILMTKILKIDGMMCGHCEARVKNALEELPGVERADVSHIEGTAAVSFIGLSDEQLISAVEKQGYKVLSIE